MRQQKDRPESAPPPPARAGNDGLWAFFTLACGITWLLATPAARAWLDHRTPSPFAVACAGLSALGPLLAAAVVAGRRRELGAVFGRWRTGVGWVALALVVPATIHLAATLLDALAGGPPGPWFHPPSTPEQLAALVLFPLGEELGWRGFAYPRLVRRHGPIKGSLVVGGLWGLWHLLYGVTPEHAGFDALAFGLLLVTLPLYSLIMGWIFERGRRSLAVALAFHAGLHLDNFQRAPRTELRLQGLHLLVLLGVAIVAARRLAAKPLADTPSH